MWLLFCVVCAVISVTSAYYRSNYYVATEHEVRAYMDDSVALPCRVDTKQCGQLHSVKWYKDANRVYVLSHAGQGRAEGDATER
ncbi:hypothetical protein JTB14_034339 [Gonioctena quinquepunctata]|nr:hypothetical protein JTB14_034339 [Gonioctena quinquepunctata]